MKIYVVLESKTERMIRFVTLSKAIAHSMCNAFEHLSLFVEDYNPIEQDYEISPRVGMITND